MKPAGIGAKTTVEPDDGGLGMIREKVANEFERGIGSFSPSQEDQDQYSHHNPFQSNRRPDNIAPTRSSVTEEHLNNSGEYYVPSRWNESFRDQEDRRYPRTSSPNYAGYQQSVSPNSARFSFNGSENNYDDNSRSMDDNFGLNPDQQGKFC